METKIIEIDPENPEPEKIERASSVLKDGNLVAFPTETVYGLGASALNKDAVEKIFIAKGRPSDNPLIVHISDISMLDNIAVSIPEKAKVLMDSFWPGPLTVVLKKTESVPTVVSAGLDTVGIRMPSNKVFLALSKACNLPIAAPSANSFSRPSPTSAKDVLEDMDGKIPLIISAGTCDVGIESTIVSFAGKKPLLLRPGGVSLEEIESKIGKIDVHRTIKNPRLKVDIAASPGMKYKHYSPTAEVVVASDVKSAEKFISSCFLNKKKVMFISRMDSDIVSVVNEKRLFKSDEELTRNVFSCFREADRKGIDFVVLISIEENGIGLGLMNRIKKAASKTV